MAFLPHRRIASLTLDQLPEIDWSKPLARGLLLAAMPFGNTFINVVNGEIAGIGGTAPTRSDFQDLSGFNYSAGYHAFNNAKIPSSSADMSVQVSVRYRGSTTGNQGLIGINSGGLNLLEFLYSVSNGGLYRIYTNTGVNFTNFAPVTGVEEQVGFAKTGAGSYTGYQNGLERSTISNTGASYAANSGIRIGEADGDYWQSDIYYAFVFDRLLANDEWLLLSNEPEQLFIKKDKNLFFPQDVSAGLTGNAITAAPGALATVRANALSGGALTLSAGALLKATVAAFSGQPLSAVAGALASGSALTLAGNAQTLALSAPVPGLSVSVEGYGLNAVGGGVSPAAVLGLTGSPLLAWLGPPAPETAQALAGLDCSLTIAPLLPGARIVLTGAGAFCAAGALSPALAPALSGLGLTIDSGALTVLGNNDVTVALSGATLAIIQGALMQAHEIGLAGPSLTLNIAALLPEITRLLIGRGVALEPGGVAVNIDLIIAGRSLTIALGNVGHGATAESVDWLIIEQPGNKVLACSANSRLLISHLAANIVLEALDNKVIH